MRVLGDVGLSVIDSLDIFKDSNYFADNLSRLLFRLYFYESLRRVYGERRLRTLANFSTLAVGYMVCAVAMVFLTALYGAETL